MTSTNRSNFQGQRASTSPQRGISSVAHSNGTVAEKEVNLPLQPLEVPGGDDDGLGEAFVALDGALGKKALEPTLLDVRGLCSYANYILLVSGRSDRQVDAISEGIVQALRERGVRALGVEGQRSGQWALLDFGDFVAHVFHHPLREHYDLEGLWIDAKRIALEVPDEARISATDVY